MSSQSRALISPQADFWLLGGLSFVSLAAIWAVTKWANPGWSREIIALTFYGSFIVNYPHFIYSYQLFYKDFYSYLRSPDALFSSKVRLFIAGIIVPLVIAAFFVLVGFTHDLVLLGYGLSVYLFLSGWHFVKQGYGVLITTSVYKRIFYSERQKRILFGNAYLVWLFSWIQLYNYAITKVTPAFFDAPYAVLQFPAWLQHLSLAATGISTLLAAWVLFSVWREKKDIAFNGIIGYVASSYVWLLLPSAGLVFTMAIPFFHSLQYMPFVYKFKKNELEAESQSKELRKSNGAMILLYIFIGVGIFLGALLFFFMPAILDKMHGSWGGNFTNYFFIISFTVFINVHHFFIDHAFWRKDNVKIQKFLFQA